MKKVYLYGVIGYEEAVPQKFLAQLPESGEEFELRINSPGGSVFDGFAMLATLEGRKYTAYIDGIAGSMASVIAAASEKVIANRNAMFMIHKAKGGNHGTADEMKASADMLEKIDKRAFEIYSKRWKKKPEELMQAIAATTFFTADEMLAAGLADEIQEFTPEREIEIDDKTEMGQLLFAKMQVISGVKSVHKPELNSMKELAVLLGLAEGAALAELTASVKSLQNAKQVADQTVAQLRADLSEASAKVSTAQAALAAAEAEGLKLRMQNETEAILKDAAVVLGAEHLAKLETRIARMYAAAEADRAELRIDAVNYAKLNGVPAAPVSGFSAPTARTQTDDAAKMALVNQYATDNKVSYAEALVELVKNGKVKV